MHGVQPDSLWERYRRVRAISLELTAPLEIEDHNLQCMPDVSPPKWHLAHTTWFFETQVLEAHLPGYRSFDRDFHYLFNSYYESLGPRHARPHRGWLSRPGLERVIAYRARVDAAVGELLAGPSLSEELVFALQAGIHHEQQHQELLLTDIKFNFWSHPQRPAYLARPASESPAEPPVSEVWVEVPEGVHEIGYEGGDFCYDNERPRHRAYVGGVALRSTAGTNGEYLAFVEDGGYRRPEFWLSDGWDTVGREGWQAPQYWEREGDRWYEFTLYGRQPLDPAGPVSHLSYFEADAFARWAGCRLPLESEWEVLAARQPVTGHLQERRLWHPVPVSGDPGPLHGAFGSVWEWTQSHYSPYPGFRPFAGALGEYNGKFMCGQFVLRGGSCFTPGEHLRYSYRNFFHPHARWQMTGVRLARDNP